MGRLENLLGALSLTVADRVVAADAGARLSATDQAALVTLAEHPDRTVSWLGNVLGLTSSGATRLVDRLVAGGWVRRSAGEDSRQRRLRLTDDGSARAHQLQQARLDSLAESLAPLDAAQREQLELLLESMVSGLTTSYVSALTTCRLCDISACREHGQTCPLHHTVPEDDPDA
jgi:DNA-binding MarR family transcriptional regulator